MSKRSWGWVALSFALLLGRQAAAAPDNVFKSADVFDLAWVAGPQISPDGRHVAYVRMNMDIKTDKARPSILNERVNAARTSATKASTLSRGTSA